MAQYGLRGVRVGGASHPAPATKRRRALRLRALQRSRDSDGESSSDDVTRPTQLDIDSENERPLVRSASVPADVTELASNQVVLLRHQGQWHWFHRALKEHTGQFRT